MAEIAGIPCLPKEPMARHLPLRTGAHFGIWVEVATEAELLAVIRFARAERMAIRPVAPFGDALPTDADLSGIALRLGRDFEKVEKVEGGVRIGAAAPLALLGLYPGYTSFLRAPGTLYDAWEEGWIAPALGTVRRFRSRGFEEVEDATPDPKSLIVSAVVKPDVRVSPPLAGAPFKDPRKRGGLKRLLDREGLLGLRVHGASLAAPEVLVNRGGATAHQLRVLITVVKERMQSATGVVLEERLAPPGRGGRL